MSKPCPHPRTYKNRNAKPDVNCSMLVTTNILHIQWFNAMALFCRCCLLLPVFRKSVLCLSRVLGDLAWHAGYSSHGGRWYVVCSSRQRPAPFDWRRMLTHAFRFHSSTCCILAKGLTSLCRFNVIFVDGAFARNRLLLCRLTLPFPCAICKLLHNPVQSAGPKRLPLPSCNQASSACKRYLAVEELGLSAYVWDY